MALINTQTSMWVSCDQLANIHLRIQSDLLTKFSQISLWKFNLLQQYLIILIFCETAQTELSKRWETILVDEWESWSARVRSDSAGLAVLEQFLRISGIILTYLNGQSVRSQKVVWRDGNERRPEDDVVHMKKILLKKRRFGMI